MSLRAGAKSLCCLFSPAVPCSPLLNAAIWRRGRGQQLSQVPGALQPVTATAVVTSWLQSCFSCFPRDGAESAEVSCLPEDRPGSGRTWGGLGQPGQQYREPRTHLPERNPDSITFQDPNVPQEGRGYCPLPSCPQAARRDTEPPSHPQPRVQSSISAHLGPGMEDPAETLF